MVSSGEKWKTLIFYTNHHECKRMCFYKKITFAMPGELIYKDEFLNKYKDKIIGKYTLDFLINNEIIVELKVQNEHTTE